MELKRVRRWVALASGSAVIVTRCKDTRRSRAPSRESSGVRVDSGSLTRRYSKALPPFALLCSQGAAPPPGWDLEVLVKAGGSPRTCSRRVPSAPRLAQELPPLSACPPTSHPAAGPSRSLKPGAHASPAHHHKSGAPVGLKVHCVQHRM